MNDGLCASARAEFEQGDISAEALGLWRVGLISSDCGRFSIDFG